MPSRKFTILFIFLASLGLQGVASADMFPHDSVDAMCDKADAIIEGTYLGKNKVRIDRIHKSSPLLKTDSQTINVAQLDEHDRTLWKGFRKNQKTIETNKLVLFLVHGKTPNPWESMATIVEGDKCGSCGVFWFDDSACYGYGQVMNPGPYVLTAAGGSGSRVPESLEALRASIRTGLANSRAWRKALAVTDPAEKASALSRYLLERTAPEGDKGSYRYAVREPMRELGQHAVGALVSILENAKPDDDLNNAVLILYDIGPDAKRAVPHLCRLLSSPKQVHTGYVLVALGSIGDREAIAHVRPLLKHEDFGTAVEASQVLAKLNDHASFQDMASLVPAHPRKVDKYRIRDLLNALFALDPQQAAPIIRKTAASNSMVDVREQIMGLDGKANG